MDDSGSTQRSGSGVGGDLHMEWQISLALEALTGTLTRCALRFFLQDNTPYPEIGSMHSVFDEL